MVAKDRYMIGTDTRIRLVKSPMSSPINHVTRMMKAWGKANVWSI